MVLKSITRYLRPATVLAVAVIFTLSMAGIAQAGITDLNVPTYKPLLTGKNWVAISGMPVSTTAGAITFMRGGNAVDAACTMLGAAGVMSDGMHVGGETQALVYNPNDMKVYGINGMGIAPTGATADYFIDKGMPYPPSNGALAAATPGTPGGLMLMLAEFGSMSLGEVLEPVIELADGYVLTGYRGGRLFQESNVKLFLEWGFSGEVWVPGGVPMEFGQVTVQRDLANTLRKLVQTEKQALAAGKSRKEAIMAAYDRFYKGDIAREIARGSQAGGGLHTYEDLVAWDAYVEEPRMTTYHDYEVYKLQEWTQGPVLLQTLNILEGIDLASMDRNSAEYVHALYQAMNLAYADRDFYYGDPYFPPKEPMEGLLSKEYAAERRKLINWEKNDPNVAPGDPYPFMGEKNPFLDNLEEYKKQYLMKKSARAFNPEDWDAGTTSIQAADIEGWVVSLTPSG
jgi:gamma-glutamyltranspeptidase/glutathione hydrolase